MTLRSRLIAAFLASTLLPLGATVWITTLLDPAFQCDDGRARSTLPRSRTPPNSSTSGNATR